MSDGQFVQYIEMIRQQIAALSEAQGEAAKEKMIAVLEALQLSCEEMQTTIDAKEAVEEELFEQNQQLAESYQRYYNLFQFSPIADLVTDTNGVIVEANQKMARLLNMPQHYLSGKPLAVFVAKNDRPTFRTRLNQLLLGNSHVWRTRFCPKYAPLLAVELHVDVIRSVSGLVEELRIRVHPLSQSQPIVSPSTQKGNPNVLSGEAETPLLLPQSLDGLELLVVDDEADAREFIAAVLESYGVRVRTVASAAAALEELKRSCPDVLMSDIRMPGGDGYSLIRQVRALEAEQGGHIPAAAMTAYLEEDRAKALSAGFEAYLHKLAQPIEWFETVAQLAGWRREI